MYVAYFDESGTDERSRSFCVAGFVGHQADWFELSRVWRALLRESGLPAFHMTDFEARRGACAHLPESARVPLIDGLVTAIEGLQLMGIGAGVVRAHYDEVVVASGWLQRSRLSAPLWKKPYLMLFQHVLAKTCNAIEHFPVGEKVAFVFGQHDEFGGRARMVFQQLDSEPSWLRHGRLGSLEFLPPHDRPGLQAADILAYEFRKGLDNRLTGRARPERKPLTRLLLRTHVAEYFTADTLRQMAHEVDPAA